MEEKKLRGYIWLIVILSLLVIGLASYLVYDKFIKDDDKVKETDKGNDKDKTDDNNKDKEENNGKYLKVDKYDYTINGKKHVIAFHYSNEINAIDELDNFVTISIDNKIIGDTKICLEQGDLNIDEAISIKSMNGTDKDYLVVTILNYWFILTDEGKILEDFTIDESSSFSTLNSNRDEFYGKISNKYHENQYELNISKITDSAIYYLELNCMVEETSEGLQHMIDEYKVTVANGKVAKEKVGEYKATVENAWCP